MLSRRLAPILAVFALISVACGSSLESSAGPDIEASRLDGSGDRVTLRVEDDGDGQTVGGSAVIEVEDDGDHLAAAIPGSAIDEGAIDGTPADGSPETAESADGTDQATGTTVAGAAPTATPARATKPLVIFDTDMGPDVDDALALAMLHGYQQLGMIELAAVTISRNSETAARYTDALNTFYGRPNIPIGILRSGGPYFSDQSNYVSLAGSWPNDISSAQIQDGYKLQRQVLADAAAAGRSVLIVQTGFSGNTSNLVNSGGDSISPRSGVELIRSAVTELSVMAGSIDINMVEFNIEKDVAPARNLFAKWPGKLALSPFELGNNIHYPYASIRSDLAWTARHPIREAYEYSDLGWHVDAPPFYNMRSWDLTSVIQAVEPQSNYFLTSGTGTVSVDGNGRTFFKPGSGQHYVLDRGRQYSGQQRQRIVDRMIELVSHRP